MLRGVVRLAIATAVQPGGVAPRPRTPSTGLTPHGAADAPQPCGRGVHRAALALAERTVAVPGTAGTVLPNPADSVTTVAAQRTQIAGEVERTRAAHPVPGS